MVLLQLVARRVKENPQAASLSFATVAFATVVLLSTLAIELLEKPAEDTAIAAEVAAWEALDREASEAVADIAAYLRATGLSEGGELLTKLAFLNTSLQSLNGEHPDEEERNWTFMGSLYFVFTIVTTIGYGTFAPQTGGGRFVTVVISFLGTGAFAYFIARLSAIFNKFTAWLANRLNVTSNYRRAAVILGVIVAYWLLGALIFDEMCVAATLDRTPSQFSCRLHPCLV